MSAISCDVRAIRVAVTTVLLLKNFRAFREKMCPSIFKIKAVPFITFMLLQNCTK
jgi:hypothetical protein